MIWIIGAFMAGGLIGIFLMCAVYVSKNADEKEREMFNRKSVEKGDEMR